MSHSIEKDHPVSWLQKCILIVAFKVFVILDLKNLLSPKLCVSTKRSPVCFKMSYGYLWFCPGRLSFHYNNGNSEEYRGFNKSRFYVINVGSRKITCVLESMLRFMIRELTKGKTQLVSNLMRYGLWQLKILYWQCKLWKKNS